jgi:uncharacterized protein (DUF4213/DUF364 family)/nucleoside-triphosphatase THEP1
VLYSPTSTGTSTRVSVLSEFAQELKRRHWRVGGIVQEVFTREDGARRAVDAVELDTGRRIPLSRPSDADIDAGLCGLDRSALAEATGAVRRAVDERVDLLVVEKFGDREKKGEGLADEILLALAEGIPTLVLVPAGALNSWIRFTGGLGDLLAPDPAALWRWWGPHNLYRELIASVPNAPVRRVVIGLHWTLIEGERGCGLAHTPARDAAGCHRVPEAGALAGKSLAELARLAQSWNPFETAIGIAAINAHTNRPDLEGEAVSGLDLFTDIDGPLTVIGRFPGLNERLPGARIVELEPREGEYPAPAADWLLPESEAVVITASALVNRSLPGLIEAGRGACLALIGPGTPLSPHLFAYGLDALAGFVVENPEAIARIIAEGGGQSALKPHGRYVTLRREYTYPA